MIKKISIIVFLILTISCQQTKIQKYYIKFNKDNLYDLANYKGELDQVINSFILNNKKRMNNIPIKQTSALAKKLSDYSRINSTKVEMIENNKMNVFLEFEISNKMFTQVIKVSLLEVVDNELEYIDSYIIASEAFDVTSQLLHNQNLVE